MKIEVASIRKAPGETRNYEFREEIPAFEVGGTQVSFDEPAIIHLNVTNTGVSLSLKGEISGTLNLNCSRCLEPFRYNLATAFEEQYRHITETGDGENDELNYQVYEENTIDLTDVIRENIIIAMPMKNICTPGCKGICPTCGVNKNLEECTCKNEDFDPRLAVLKDLLKNS